eukprot:TRINITY_DN32397_c0_g1_i1.p1 TRINITY_DN32397_c0_g1~~TRINITY_DN32397_c0_g1_i1.p1  ORF type:complete len:348 (+),score=75.86 TRINITY_DN32397_c0_g1_i1:141-1184(+)
MFDFDAMDEQEETQAGVLEQSKKTSIATPSSPLLKQPAAPAKENLASSSQPRSTPDETGTGTVSISVCHAIYDWRVTVVVPEKALFKHVKRALAKLILKDSTRELSGQLMRKERGVYCAYKDKAAVGNVREVLLVGCEVDCESAPAEKEVHLGVDELGQDDESSSSFSSSSKGFTRERAISLQQELRLGFQSDSFQAELQRLCATRESEGLSHTRFLAERAKIFLTVQRLVLPRYGFEGSPAGVFKMMGAMQPYLKDPEFVSLAEEINALLGIDYSPPESWGSLSQNCSKLDEPAVSKRSHGTSQQKQKQQTQFRPRPLGGVLGPVPSLFSSQPLRLPEALAQGLNC